MSIRTIFHYFLVLSPISGPRIQAIQRDAGIRRGAPTPSRGAPVSTPEVRPLPWREAGRTGVGGGTPKPPPKRAAPSLDSPAGRETERGWGHPPTPYQRGLGRLWTLRRRGGGADRGWGHPQSPHQRGLRRLWTLPPDRGPGPGAPNREGGSRAAQTKTERRSRELWVSPYGQTCVSALFGPGGPRAGKDHLVKGLRRGEPDDVGCGEDWAYFDGQSWRSV